MPLAAATFSPRVSLATGLPAQPGKLSVAFSWKPGHGTKKRQKAEFETLKKWRLGGSIKPIIEWLHYPIMGGVIRVIIDMAVILFLLAESSSYEEEGLQVKCRDRVSSLIKLAESRSCWTRRGSFLPSTIHPPRSTTDL